jgi:hypothetical protein
MAEFQTTGTSLDMIRGSGKLEVATYIDGSPTWYDVGAIADLSVEEMLGIATEEADNVEGVDRVHKQEISIKFTQLEILDSTVWQVLRGALDTVETESDETRIHTGNKTEIPYFMVRITTKNDGRPVYFYAYKCNLKKGFSLDYSKDDAEDRRVKNAIEVVGKQDSARNYFVWSIMFT